MIELLREYVKLVVAESIKHLTFNELQRGDMIVVYSLENPTSSYVTNEPTGDYKHDHIGVVVKTNKDKLTVKILGDLFVDLHILSCDSEKKFKVVREDS